MHQLASSLELLPRSISDHSFAGGIADVHGLRVIRIVLYNVNDQVDNDFLIVGVHLDIEIDTVVLLHIILCNLFDLLKHLFRACVRHFAVLHVKCESFLVCIHGQHFYDTSIILRAVLEFVGRWHIAALRLPELVKVEFKVVEVNDLISVLRPAIAIDDPETPWLCGVILEPAFKARPVVQVDEDAPTIRFPVLIGLPLVEPVFGDQDRALHPLHALLLLWSRLLRVEIWHDFCCRLHLIQGPLDHISDSTFFAFFSVVVVILYQSLQFLGQGAWDKYLLSDVLIHFFRHVFMCKNFVDIGASVLVNRQQPGDHIVELLRVAKILDWIVFAFLDLHALSHVIVHLEWTLESYHFVEKTADGPDIALRAVLLVIEDLGRHVVQSAGHRFPFCHSISELGCLANISDFDGEVVREKDVFGF